MTKTSAFQELQARKGHDFSSLTLRSVTYVSFKFEGAYQNFTFL